MFNELSMGVAEPFRPDENARNILLVGDSLVMGGNLTDQPQRLGPLMNVLCPRVWPVGAGSWAFLNELRYLHQHADILSSLTRIVFVLNSADFGEASRWISERTHPTQRPVLALWYVIDKKLFPAREAPPIGDSDWRSEFAWLRREYPGPITIVLYPTRAEVLDARSRSVNLNAAGEGIGSGMTSYVVIADGQDWSSSSYRDEIHPTDEGNAKLARRIVASIPECKNEGAGH
ncbi:hypothetical protein I6F20_24680 [Bradyrhizobium sp. IC3123]|uniref:hypothetical protein n=1 Tax=Bradyrhizobium sp. IC3123 TaxID=2793803 RepID=UPI001CD2D493|nr:hypothetical protein [Bradyrhizobium sp. IC3123]MCA1392272.1 hypothetical protein [Bradyrhizobium sp. IC3123]